MPTLEQELKKFPTLSVARQADVIKEAKNNKKFRTKFVEANVGLVQKSAYSLPIIEVDKIEELINIGIITLYKLIDDFDINREVKFSTYAYKSIEGYMRNYLMTDYSELHVPKNFVNLCIRYDKWVYTYFKNHGRNPDIKETIEGLNIDENNLRWIQYVNQYTKTTKIKEKKFQNIYWELEGSFACNDDEENSYYKMPLNTFAWENQGNLENDVCEGILLEEIWEKIELLPEQERICMLLYYKDNTMTYKKIGQELGVSTEWVRCLHNKALKKIRFDLDIIPKENTKKIDRKKTV